MAEPNDNGKRQPMPPMLFTLRDVAILGGVVIAMGGAFFEIRANTNRLAKIEDHFVSGDKISAEINGLRQELNDLQKLEREDAAAIAALRVQTKQ